MVLRQFANSVILEHVEEHSPADPVAAPRDESRALQILATEHWSLLATRANGWNETFSRAGLYLTVLSASVVALALVAQATEFDDRFALFALVLLPVVFFIGVATTVRVAQSSAEDLRWVIGMNRIRHAYLEMEPSLAPYFVTSSHDDELGLLTTFGARKTRMRVGYLFITTPGMLAVVNSVVGGVFVAVIVHALGGSAGWAVAAAAVTFLGVMSVHFLVGARAGLHRKQSLTARFPTSPNQAEIP